MSAPRGLLERPSAPILGGCPTGVTSDFGSMRVRPQIGSGHLIRFDERPVQINFGGREIALKLVYYGPALSGKTTNLRSLHQMTTEGSRGRLMTLETKDDRTLFFDMLPLTFKADGSAARAAGDRSMTLRVKIFTVPGQ